MSPTIILVVPDTLHHNLPLAIPPTREKTNHQINNSSLLKISAKFVQKNSFLLYMHRHWVLRHPYRNTVKHNVSSLLLQNTCWLIVTWLFSNPWVDTFSVSELFICLVLTEWNPDLAKDSNSSTHTQKREQLELLSRLLGRQAKTKSHSSALL